MVGMLTSFLSKDSGIINQFIRLFHGTPVNFMIKPGMFKTIYVVSGIWQSTGYGSIIYLAALESIDLSLYEAAVVDGASRWKRIIHITIPWSVRIMSSLPAMPIRCFIWWREQLSIFS